MQVGAKCHVSVMSWHKLYNNPLPILIRNLFCVEFYGYGFYSLSEIGNFRVLYKFGFVKNM